MPKVKSEKIELFEAGGPMEHTVRYTVNNEGLFIAQVRFSLHSAVEAVVAERHGNSTPIVSAVIT